jgi:hypothetical protein
MTQFRLHTSTPPSLMTSPGKFGEIQPGSQENSHVTLKQDERRQLLDDCILDPDYSPCSASET